MRGSAWVVLVALLLPGVAWAQNEDEARAAVRRGLAAFARRDAETALTEYRRAIELVPDANLPHRYAAEALAELERYEEAIEEYQKYLAIKPDVSDAAEVQSRIAWARTKIDGAVAVTSSPAGADVYVDGAATKSGVTPLARLTLRRGHHTLVVRLAGHKDVVLTPVVKGGETLALACDFADPASTRPAEPKTPASPAADDAALSSPPPSSPAPSRPAIGWILFGGGAAVLAGSLVVDAAVLAPAYDDFDKKRKAGDPSDLDAKNKVTTLKTSLLVGYGVGAVATVVGATILLWPRSPRPASASLSPLVGPGFAGLSITGSSGLP